MERLPLPDAIDVFFLILCLRVIYSAIARGIVCEGFKIASLVASSLCALHWYGFLDAYAERTAFLNKQYLDFISFLVIFFSIHAIFSLARLIATSLFKRKEIPIKERWVLLFVGSSRAVLLSSVILFMLHLSPLDPQYFAQGISSRIFKNIAPKFYLVALQVVIGAGDGQSLINKEVQEYYETATFLSGDHSERH